MRGLVGQFEYADDGGLQTSCSHRQAAFWDGIPTRAPRPKRSASPLADGTLVKLPVAADSALIPSLLTLVDVVGDGAVGPMAVLSAKRLGAEQIILIGRHPARTDLGIEFGATDVVTERGDEGIAKVRELTGGHGSHAVLEVAGHGGPPTGDVVDRTAVWRHPAGITRRVVGLRTPSTVTRSFFAYPLSGPWRRFRGDLCGVGAWGE